MAITSCQKRLFLILIFVVKSCLSPVLTWPLFLNQSYWSLYSMRLEFCFLLVSFLQSSFSFFFFFFPILLPCSSDWKVAGPPGISLILWFFRESYKCGSPFRVTHASNTLSIDRVRGCLGVSLWSLWSCKKSCGFFFLLFLRAAEIMKEAGVCCSSREMCPHIWLGVNIFEILKQEWGHVWPCYMFQPVGRASNY